MPLRPEHPHNGEPTPESDEARIPIIELDLSEAWDLQGFVEKFIEKLREVGLEPEKYLYSGFNWKYLKKLLESGNYSRKGIIFCSTFSDLLEEPEDSAIWHATDKDDSGIAVYNKEFLAPDDPREKDPTESASSIYTIREGTKPSQLIKYVLHLKI